MQSFDTVPTETDSVGLLQTSKPESILNLVDRACALETMGLSFSRLAKEGMSLEALRMSYNAVYVTDASALESLSNIALEESNKVTKALELTRSVYDAVGRMYESISKNLASLASFIAKKIRHFTIDVDAVRTKAFRLKEELKTLKLNKPTFPTVKPEFKFLYLCNSKGFSNDLAVVCKATKELVVDHKTVLHHINNNEKDWISSDLPSTLSDFDRWSFDRGAVVPNSAKDVGGQWNGQRAKPESTLFAIQDLYGCRDFLTQTSIVSKTTGPEVIERLERLDYGFVQNRFYRSAASALNDYSKLSTKQWRKITLEAGYGRITDIDVSEELKRLELLGAHTSIKIDKRFAFEAMDIPKIQATLDGVIALCEELVSWSEAAYKDAWKTSLIDDLFDQLNNGRSDEPNAMQVKRMIKSRCAAFIDLSRRYHGNLDNHAFRVADACLSYVEKNMRLYQEELI